MIVVPMVRARGWVERNEVALARAYGATKAVYDVCRSLQEGMPVDELTVRGFRRRAELTSGAVLVLAVDSHDDGVCELARLWVSGLARAASFLDFQLSAGFVPEASADVLEPLLHVGLALEDQLGGHPECEAAMAAAFARAAHPAAG